MKSSRSYPKARTSVPRKWIEGKKKNLLINSSHWRRNPEKWNRKTKKSPKRRKVEHQSVERAKKFKLFGITTPVKSAYEKRKKGTAWRSGRGDPRILVQLKLKTKPGKEESCDRSGTRDQLADEKGEEMTNWKGIITRHPKG